MGVTCFDETSLFDGGEGGTRQHGVNTRQFVVRTVVEKGVSSDETKRAGFKHNQ